MLKQVTLNSQKWARGMMVGMAVATGVSFLMLCFSFGSAFAAPTKKRAVTKKTKQTNAKAKKRVKRSAYKRRRRVVRRKRRGSKNWRKTRRAFRIGRVKVGGKAHKPEVVYHLYRSKMEYRKKGLHRNYLRKVIGSVQRRPF